MYIERGFISDIQKKNKSTIAISNSYAPKSEAGKHQFRCSIYVKTLPFRVE